MTSDERKSAARLAVKMSYLIDRYGRENCGVDAWQRGQEDELPRGVKYGFYWTRAAGFCGCFVRPAA